MNLKFYRADTAYCKFLRETDARVPYIDDNKNTRPFVGVLFAIGEFNYFAPLTSPKPKHKTMKNTIDFLKMNSGEWGAINFNNMIPIHYDNLWLVDVKISPSDSTDDINYKNLLANQLSWCNANKAVIIKRAQTLYRLIVTKKAAPKLVSRCCNFIKNEEQYIIWCIENNLIAFHKSYGGTHTASRFHQSAKSRDLL